jgi:hypothetical protein
MSEFPPLPYVAGRLLKLKHVGGNLYTQVKIIHVFDITMSPVMVVQFQDGKAEPQTAVLKVFDRRFGLTRQRARNPEMLQYTTEAEVAWQDYVRSGKAQPRLARLEHDFSRGVQTTSDAHENSNASKEQQKREAMGEDECKIFHDLRLGYHNEVRAYKQLESLQGISIPQFMGEITWDGNAHEAPADLDSDYFTFRGFLMEYVEGFPLSDLVYRKPNDNDLWQTMIQRAADCADEINRLGVINYDCKPNNFLVTSREDQLVPVMIDFGWSAVVIGGKGNAKSIRDSMAELIERTSGNRIETENHAQIR